MSRPGARGRAGGWPAKLRRLTAILLVQGLILLLVLEVAGRVADPLGISYYPETASYLDTLIEEEPIGYRNTPGLAGRFWGVDVSINALGLRDREIDPQALDDEEYRILVMGDSWPFGLGVEYEDSIPFLLEQRLNEIEADTRFRTINMGVPSYNSEQELVQLRQLGLSLDPRMIVLMFAVNDVEHKMWVLDKRRNWFVNLAQRSYAACLLVVLGRKVRGLLAPKQGLINSSVYRESNPRWQAIDASLTGIHALSRERDITLVLVTDITEAHPALGLLRALGRREGFEVIRLAVHEDPRWADIHPLELNNSATDSHPNPEGTRAEVTLIVEGLERIGALPAPELAGTGH